jgi:3-methyl-2-oxobutanoate hydroxymethyltransferase
MAETEKRVRVPDLIGKKGRGEKIVVLTAYDFPTARILDRAGVDVLLAGDSLGNVILGFDSTLPVTMDAMVHHTAAVSRGARRALVVADMPFLAAQVSVADAVRNAGRLISEGGASAVKIEGGRPVADAIRRLCDIGIPVMGHLGLTPQSVHQLGGYRQQARDEEAAAGLLEDAKVVAAAGAFSLVLESVPDGVARAVTAALPIPTIGIGAGPHCDGQVLVLYDMLGLSQGPAPPFVRRYADVGAAVLEAVREYAADVRAGRYPAGGEKRP